MNSCVNLNQKLVTLLPSPRGKSGWPWTEDICPVTMMRPQTISWPRISIITPSYNQSPFIEETIRSVLLQGYPNLEYIVMDGESTDGTVEILRKYEPYFSYLHVGPDGGQAAAIAEGFNRATGEIMAWLNSDDRYRPGTLLRVAQFFVKHPRVVFGNGDVNYIDVCGSFLERIYAIPPNHLLTASIGLHGWPQQGCFWRRNAYLRAGGVDESLRFCMDRDLFIRLTAQGVNRRIPGPALADFRIHDKAKTSTIPDVAQREGELLCRKYSNKWLASNRWLAQILWWMWCKPTNLRARLNWRYGWEL